MLAFNIEIGDEHLPCVFGNICTQLLFFDGGLVAEIPPIDVGVSCTDTSRRMTCFDLGCGRSLGVIGAGEGEAGEAGETVEDDENGVGVGVGDGVAGSGGDVAGDEGGGYSVRY